MSNNIIDTASPFLLNLARTMPKELGRAVKSVGWFLREEIKKGIAVGAPGGEQYPPLSDITANRLLDAIRNREKTKKGKWRKARLLKARGKYLGKLSQATRYVFYSDSIRVITGWVNKSAERLGILHEKGGQVKITPKMRRFFWAAGIPLSKGKAFIRIPKRATIAPTSRANESKIPKRIEESIWRSIQRQGG